MVRVLDDLSTGIERNLADVASEVELVVGEIQAKEVTRRAVDGVDVIYHLAARPSVARSIEDPFATHQVNVEGTLAILLAAKDSAVRRVVFASSSSVYGETAKLPKTEEMVPAPVSPYAASKAAGEAYCAAFSAAYGLETVCLRFFNVYGPRQDPASEYAAVIPRFVTGMLAGNQPPVFGDGLQSRDFTFVSDAVEACILAARSNTAAGEPINVARGERTSLIEIISVINEILGTQLQPEFLPPRPGDIRHSQASISKARELLDYSCRIPVREGLRETISWFEGVRSST